MGSTFIQSNLTGGEIAPQLHARIDIDKYNTAVAIAENVVIVPQGGLRRRPGLSKITDGAVGEDARMAAFVFNTTQQYLFVFKAAFIDVYRDGVIVKADLPSPFLTIEEVNQLDIIQSADTMIITHEDYAPRSIVRGATDADWTLATIALTIPTYDFGAGAEPVWSATRGYPTACAFHGGRLWFAGSTQKPTSVWGSRVNGYYDFTAVGTPIPDDHAIFDTLEAAQYNKITNIFSGRSLQVFTTGAEYYNSVDIITPSDSSWKSQTGYGSKGLRPIFIDGATLFVDSSGRTIREFVYSFDEDGYVSNSITLLASHLLTDVQAISSIKGTSIDISDYVYVVNTDGSLAVMNTLRNEGILGWTHWTTDGEFLDVTVVDKSVYFLVKREGAYFIELLNEDSYTDHNVIIPGTAPETFNVIYGEDNIVDNGDNIVYTDISTGVPITEIDTNFDPVFDNTYFKVVADFSVQDDAKPEVTSPGVNKFTITRDAYHLEVGLGYNTKITTLPINTNLANGATLHRRKRVVKTEINIYESLGIYARDIYSSDRKFTVALDQAPAPITGFKELYLLGYSRITQIEITQEQPLPMLIRALGYEIAY